MSDKPKNALAELAEEAEELKRVLEDLKFDRRVVVCDKLQRIVAVLAKVSDVKHSLGHISPNMFESADAIDKCREIAEEGASDVG